jgi:predicted lipoprotein with Yx(FWY)xxD motif
MSDNQMTSKQRKELAKKEFYRKFGRYWLLYGALLFTGILSFIGGLMLPFMKPDVNVPLTWGTAGAGLFYALGFLLIGEGAANFWFDRVTDQDPDNNTQKLIAGVMIAVSVLVSASTALATSYIIAYWVGVFDAFLTIPVWAQKYIAIAVPVVMVINAVAAIIFKSVSDEAAAERDANAVIRQAENEAREARSTARANWVKANAPRLAQEMGEMEAENDLDALRAKIREEKSKRNNGQPVYTYNQDTKIASDNGNGSDPHSRRS